MIAYINTQHFKQDANRIIDDIDWRIAVVAPFTGLHWFPQGRGFNQWTGNNSKALMKVLIFSIFTMHITHHIVGLHCRTWKLCAQRNYTHNSCIHGILLPRASPCHWWVGTAQNRRCIKPFSWISQGIPGWWQSSHDFVPAFPTACCEGLSHPDSSVQHPQWFMFIHYRM